eukprot:TRINITY_DN2519_c0_g1_i4.p2 TRINITY_DN2519_c0_g1~~TRINITY_DN2519_c0_g1_i4.p2  ORF type:complete len:257 (-),score=68.62 TRINITY_DN2519_c0_g1_i4:66-836(-)
METFGNIVSYFGPLNRDVSQAKPDKTLKTSKKSTNFLDKIQNTLMAPWFHGDLDSNEAAKLLKTYCGPPGAQQACSLTLPPTPPGGAATSGAAVASSFLVRFSSREPGCFTLSRMITVPGQGGQPPRQEIQHHRLPNGPNGLLFGKMTFPTVTYFVKKASKALQLQNPVQLSRYAQLRSIWITKLQQRDNIVAPGCGIYMNVATRVRQPGEESVSGGGDGGVPTMFPALTPPREHEHEHAPHHRTHGQQAGSKVVK